MKKVKIPSHIKLPEWPESLRRQIFEPTAEEILKNRYPETIDSFNKGDTIDTMKQDSVPLGDGYIHPITKRWCPKAKLEVALRNAERDYLCKNTTMGKVAAIAVIAAYKKALGLPLPELKFEGRKLDLSTVELDEKGNPSFQMPAPELDYWNGVELMYGNQCACLLYEGHRRVCVERKGMGLTDLNDKEWQRCIDLISIAPKLKKIVQKLASNSGNIDELIKASRELIAKEKANEQAL